jgi:hypothetical protein
MSDIPTFDPATAISDIRGYAMYAYKGAPWVVHTYSVRITDDKGTKRPVRRIEHLKLDADAGWGDTATATAVRGELKKQWADWIAWDQAMKESK